MVSRENLCHVLMPDRRRRGRRIWSAVDRGSAQPRADYCSRHSDLREVAGGHAFYFTGHQAEALAAAIKEWLTLYRNGKYPKSDAMPWMTWAQSVERLKDVVLRGDWYATIPSEGRQARGSRAWPGEREFGVGAEVAPR